MPLRVDGALVDEFNLPHGFWEAKDSSDNLEEAIKTKFKLGYPRRNILFQSPDRGVLYQNGTRVLDTSLTQPEQLIEILRAFLTYEEPDLDEWTKASTDFKDRIAEHGQALAALLAKERKKNSKFRTAFEIFVGLCRDSLNPALSEAAVEEMLVQHLLTWRIFKGIFDAGDFMQRNVIAREIEEVILTLGAFSREEFLKSINPFYVAVERAAAKVPDFREKQKFLNTVYERFFQGFAVKQADSLGIVYTPQPIVDFMIASTERLLADKRFHRSLADEKVHILDGFTGTGNFIVNIMQFIGNLAKSKLPHKYAEELHCNEVMLLPYYVASMNIEHSYLEIVGQYKTFEGICLVDTFNTAEEHTGGGIQQSLEFRWKANTERIKKQRQTPIFVCIGNPPYNAWQVNENDNNRNRKYPELDERVRETYGKDSTAQNRNSLADPYVKAIRWASDRVISNGEGIVAYVTNNAFLDSLACDGVRKRLAQEFDEIRVVDLGGNVRKNPKLSGTTHNVFGIQVGVSVNFFIRHPGNTKAGKRKAEIFYHAVPTDWRRTEKYDWLEKIGDITKVPWQAITPDNRHNWLRSGLREDFETFLPLGDRDARGKNTLLPAIFKVFGRGLETTRDSWVYNFTRDELASNVQKTLGFYNEHVRRWGKIRNKAKIDDFVDNDPTRVSWSSSLKQHLDRGREVDFDSEKLRVALYRPYCKQFLYFDDVLNHRSGCFPEVFPHYEAETKNVVLWIKVGGDWPIFALATNHICDLLPQGGSQCFPFYIYDEDGTNPQENISLAALLLFQSHYGDDKITRWDIFHYIYAVLHHPGYCERFAANLKRELPRIPFAPEFRTFAKAGKKLMELHLGYEQADEYPLRRRENREADLSWRVDPKMKLTRDKRALIYNDLLTLEGIPAEAFKYKLGNRSAVEWVIDQYEISIDKQSGIRNDPNRPEDEQYIVRLIGKVITVSLETLRIINSLPEDFGAAGEPPQQDKELEEWRLMQSFMSSASAQQQLEEVKKEYDSRLLSVSRVSEQPSSNGREKKKSRSKPKST
jgi:predicted helicase